MDGLNSFRPVVEGMDYLVNSDTEVALFLFINVHSFQEYQCKVKTFKKIIVKTLLWVHILCICKTLDYQKVYQTTLRYISMDNKTGFKLSLGQNQKICRAF